MRALSLALALILCPSLALGQSGVFPVGAGQASGVRFADAGTGIMATDVQAAIVATIGLIPGIPTAATVLYDNMASGLAAVTVQAAIDELAAGGGGGGGGGIEPDVLPGTPVVNWQPHHDGTRLLTIGSVTGNPPSTAMRNGNSAHYWGNANVYGNAGLIGKTASFTVITVVMLPSITAERRITGSIAASSSNETWGYIEFTGSGKIRVQFGSGAAYSWTTTNAIVMQNQTWHVLSVVYLTGDAGATIYLDGAVKASTVTGTGATTAAGGPEGSFWWGRGGSSATQGWQGSLAVYQSALSNEDREAVEALFAARYNVTLPP